MLNALSALPRLRAGALFPMLLAQLQKDGEREMLWQYIAMGLKMLTENTARVVGGSYLAVSYTDIIHQKPQDERTGEEIVADVIMGAGLKIV